MFENLRARFVKPAEKIEPDKILKSDLTLDYVRQNLPELYHALRLDWLLHFHIEDLDELPEQTLIQKILPLLPWVLLALMFLLYVFKK